MYASQNKLLTQTINKESTEMENFSTEKKPNTNQEHDYHPTLTILTILFCAWKQNHQFTHSFCRDPVGAGKILPRELCEFWKEKESLKSDIGTSGCTQEGHEPPRKPPQGCSHPVWLQGHHPTFSSSTHLESRGMNTKDRSNHNLWGQSKKGGTSI